MDRILTRNAFDLNYNTAFSSQTQLINKFKDRFKRSELKEWISKQNHLTKYATSKARFPRRPFLAHGRGLCFQTDIMFMDKKDAKINKGYLAFLILVDTFTRETYVYNLRSKKSDEIVSCFEKFFKIFKPLSIFSDFGSEFRSSAYKDCLKKHNVQVWYTSSDEIKSGLAERRGLDVKRRIARYLAYKNTRVWYDVIERIVKNINDTPTRTLGVAPSSIKSKEEQKRIFIRLYKNRIGISPPIVKPEAGSQWRLSFVRKPFQKRSMLQNYSNEKFTLVRTVPKQGVNLLQLKDSNDEMIKGLVYPREATLTS